MNKQQKQIAIGAGALVLLYLIYRFYHAQQAGAVTGSTTAPNTSSSDYAALAGQEQGDVAALQGQNSQLLAQEQSDVAAVQAQEGQDVSGLTGVMATLTTAIDTLTSGMQTETANIAAIATGQQKIDRQLTATVQIKPGSALAKYYKTVTGKNPPARLQATNFIYQAYKAGIKATALTGHTPHPSSKNQHVQHPNANHTPRTQHNGGSHGPWPTATGRVRTVTAPTGTKPPKTTKPRTSGRRR